MGEDYKLGTVNAPIKIAPTSRVRSKNGKRCDVPIGRLTELSSQLVTDRDILSFKLRTRPRLNLSAPGTNAAPRRILYRSA